MIYGANFPPQIDTNLKMGEGLFLDLSGKGNTITNNGATLTTDHRGRANKAFSFSAGKQIKLPNINSYASVNNINSTIFTLKTGADTNTRQGVIVTQNTTAHRYYIQILFNKLNFGTRDGSAIHNTAGFGIAENTQYHFVCVNLGHSVGKLIYVNGTLVTNISGEVLASGDNGFILIGGTDASISNPMLNTVIGEVATVSRALTDGEITQFYNEWRK
jgi:hypothetical protein